LLQGERHDETVDDHRRHTVVDPSAGVVDSGRPHHVRQRARARVAHQVRAERHDDREQGQRRHGAHSGQDSRERRHHAEAYGKRSTGIGNDFRGALLVSCTVR